MVSWYRKVMINNNDFFRTYPVGENKRYDNWVTASYALTAVDTHLVPICQRMGNLDCNLVDLDIELSKYHTENGANYHFQMALNEIDIFAYLWVLGSYEMIRTMSHKLDEFQSKLAIDSKEDVRNVKHLFERLRVPLAKVEPSRKHDLTDYYFPIPLFNYAKGIAWAVSDDVVITRRQLSDELLELFLSILKKLPYNPLQVMTNK
jgi:hypothetical protein